MAEGTSSVGVVSVVPEVLQHPKEGRGMFVAIRCTNHYLGGPGDEETMLTRCDHSPSRDN
jgi:hypothetical protein